MEMTPATRRGGAPTGVGCIRHGTHPRTFGFIVEWWLFLEVNCRSGAGAVPPLPFDSDDESYNTIGDHKNEEFVNVGVLMVDLGVIVQIVAEVVALVLNV